MMESKHELQGKIGITGSFDCWDKDGNLLKTITFEGTLPLENLITEDTENGTDSSERMQEGGTRWYNRFTQWW